MAHPVVMAAGGYGSTEPRAHRACISAAGGGLAVGVAWDDGRRTIALALVGALLAGEAYALLLTAERTIAHREEHQAPLRGAAESRTKSASG